MKLTPLDDWYAGLTKYSGGLPARGTLGGALAVAEALKTNFDLDLESHTAKGGSQIKGASGARLAKILAELSETRKFLVEGGRTNRGLRGEIKSFLDALEKLKIGGLPDGQRRKSLVEVQNFLLKKIREVFNRERIKFVYVSDRPTALLIGDILLAARADKKEGAVAQHLVGAKLQLRFPKINIANNPVSAADKQTGRDGDFAIQKTVFHVTVSPSDQVIEKCVANLNAGKKVFVLVPERAMVQAKYLAGEAKVAANRVHVGSIECFVGVNVDEISEFGDTELLKLLELYNDRVREAETDLSLLIDIPKNLGGK